MEQMDMVLKQNGMPKSAAARELPQVADALNHCKILDN
jgi:hypothetical protein